MRRLVFATHNNGKFEEAKIKFKEVDIQLEQYTYGYPEIQADELEDVAVYGVNYLKDKIDLPFFLEDAGLFINRLRGFPGVYSSFVFNTVGNEGILKLMKGEKKRDAVFRSVIAYMEKGKKPLVFSGECHGFISNEKRGKNGFGYDPIFIPKGETRTFGEMTIEEKNVYSHRSKAMQELIEYIHICQINKF